MQNVERRQRMANPFQSVLNWVYKNFRKDAAKMLIWTGVAGWSLSSLAQVGAVLINPKISNDKKSFLVPQEIADAAVNIASFFLITQVTKKTVAKLFSTGKFAPQKVRNYLNANKELYSKKIGKLDFDLDEVLKKNKDFPANEYYSCKNFGTTLATVGAGILSSNIVTPLIRNNMASGMQKMYNKSADAKKPVTQQPTFKSMGMRI